MGYRSHQRSGEARHDDGGMDSFVDVICNTIGVLVVIIVFSATIAQRITKLTKAPTWKAFDEKVVHVFEATEGSVYYLNRPALLKKVTSELERLGSLPARERQERLAEAQIYSGNHTVVPNDLNVGVVTVKLVENSTGGTDAEHIERPFSLFNKYLARLDPEKDTLLFVVRPSGDEIFRLATEQAKRLDFRTQFDLRAEDDYSCWFI
jgi:hypothetical protein